MVFSAKSSNNEGWGMGLLLILFHHHPHYIYNNNNKSPSSSSSPSLFSVSSSKSFNNLLFSKTQYTLSICGVLVFTTLLLFTLSTFEPTSLLHSNNLKVVRHRRILHQIPRNTHKGFSLPSVFSARYEVCESNSVQSALHGMGTLYLKGSKAMHDLIVGHVNEVTSEIELRSFLRVIYHSGVLSKSDFVFIYSSPILAMKYGHVVKSECDSFVRLVQLGGKLSESGSGLNRYLKEVGEGEKEPMWGKKRGNFTEMTRPSYGSVLGFDVSELDPEDSLSGFLDHVPMSLRRWAGYPMLLGRVRRQFKHMMLVDVKSVLILSDPFSRVRNQSTESLSVWLNPDEESLSRHHGRKNSDGKTHDPDPKTRVHAGIIVGGSRGVRRFATAALTEIVRNVIEHKGKGKNSVKVTESGLVNQLVHSGHLLKNVDLITPTESIPELSSFSEFNSGDSSSRLLKLSDNFNVVQRGRSSEVSVEYINYVIMREICASHTLYSSVYTDCLASQ